MPDAESALEWVIEQIEQHPDVRHDLGCGSDPDHNVRRELLAIRESCARMIDRIHASNKAAEEARP